MRRRQSVRGVLLPVRGLWVSGLFWVSATPRAASQSPGGAKSDPASQTAVLVGAGDVVGCRDPRGALATAKLIEAIPGTVFVLGDLVMAAMTGPPSQKTYPGTGAMSIGPHHAGAGDREPKRRSRRPR